MQVRPEYLKLLSLIKSASEIEAMIKKGEIDYKKLASLLRKFGINISEEQLLSIKEEFESTNDKDLLIQRIAELLGISKESIEEAITLFELIQST